MLGRSTEVGSGAEEPAGAGAAGVDPKSEKAKRLKSLTLPVAIGSLYLDIYIYIHNVTDLTTYYYHDFCSLGILPSSVAI